MPTIRDEVAVGVRGADPDALAEVFRVFSGPLSAWLSTELRDRTSVEEVVEETFLDLVKDCRAIDGDARSIRAWLYRAARHNLLDHVRREQRDRSDPTDELPERITGDDLAVGAIDADTARALRAVVAQLPAAQREVVTMRYLAELDTAETAAITGRSEIAVRGLLHRGLRKLRSLLPSDLDPSAAPDREGEEVA